MHFVDAKGILSAQNGMNLYRGCTHGCIYCDSRSLCYGFTHDFQDVEVKQNAPELLERALRSKRAKCMIGTGSMSDPYMPCEEQLCLTCRCLELIDRYGFGVAVQTKSTLILRDLPLLERINHQAKAVAQITLTTHDDTLCRQIEPNVSVTSERVAALEALRDHGIPTIVWLSPILPWINDTLENVDGILDSCFRAGVKGIICFGMGLTLRDGNREYFYAALDRHFPGLSARYRRTYGNAYEIPSPDSARLMEHFHRRCEQAGVMHTPEDCFRYLHEFPKLYEQTSFL